MKTDHAVASQSAWGAMFDPDRGGAAACEVAVVYIDRESGAGEERAPPHPASFAGREVVVDASDDPQADSFSCEAELGFRFSLDRLPAA